MDTLPVNITTIFVAITLSPNLLNPKYHRPLIKHSFCMDKISSKNCTPSKQNLIWIIQAHLLQPDISPVQYGLQLMCHQP